MMENSLLNACCGFNCGDCPFYELNKGTFSCVGCRVEGQKYDFCNDCTIRNCKNNSEGDGFCNDCADKVHCKIIEPLISAGKIKRY